MKVWTPEYYRHFHCIAGACPDSCCKEWEVDVDDTAAAFYRTLDGSLGDRLRQVMKDTDDGTVMIIEDGRCPMWRQDGLCRIQAQLGEQALCHTCRQFPRLRHDYGDFVELGLELSCPEAAKLILSGENAKTVVRQESGGEDAEYDPDAMTLLLESRKQALEILDTYRNAPGQALAVLLFWGYTVQARLDGEEPADFSAEDALCTAKKIAAPGDAASLLAEYRELEILTSAWEQQLQAPLGSSWSAAHIAMARYLIQRYWLQAVSDLDLICRVKFILASCLTVKLLGGEILVTAQRYSKEIENDADNIDALLDAAYTSAAMADIRLLGLLLED